MTNSQCFVLKFFLGFYGPTTTPSNTTDNSTETTTLTPNATTRSPNWKYELGLYFKLYQIYICNWSNMIYHIAWNRITLLKKIFSNTHWLWQTLVRDGLVRQGSLCLAIARDTRNKVGNRIGLGATYCDMDVLIIQVRNR